MLDPWRPSCKDKSRLSRTCNNKTPPPFLPQRTTGPPTEPALPYHQAEVIYRPETRPVLPIVYVSTYRAASNSLMLQTSCLCIKSSRLRCCQRARSPVCICCIWLTRQAFRPIWVMVDAILLFIRYYCMFWKFRHGGGRDTRGDWPRIAICPASDRCHEFSASAQS